MVAQQDTFAQDVAGARPMWISEGAADLASSPWLGVAGKGVHARATGGTAAKHGAAKRPAPNRSQGQSMESGRCTQCLQTMWVATQLQQKVMELESWKERAMHDIQALQKENSQLKTAFYAEGPSCFSHDMVSTSPGSTCSGDVSDGCSPVPSSPISLAELLPLSSSATPLGSRTPSIASSLCSPIAMSAVPAVLIDCVEPFLKVAGPSAEQGAPRFPPPPGLDPPLMQTSTSSFLSLATLVLPSSAASLPAHDVGDMSPPSRLCLALPSLFQHSLSEGPVFPADGHQGRGEAVRVGPCEVVGVDCIRAEWRVEHLSSRLKSSMGKPIVSPPFTAGGLPDLRLMVTPQVASRRRKSKEEYVATVTKGPLFGTLKLKATNLEQFVVDCYLTVGAVRRGPFSYDLSEQAVCGCEEFGVDWLKHLDSDGSCLRVSLEILQVHRK